MGSNDVFTPAVLLWFRLLFCLDTVKRLWTAFLDQVLHATCKKGISPTAFGSCPLSLLFLIPDFFISILGCLPAAPPFPLITLMPHSISSFVALVCIQVSHPTDRWGRCRCKSISSLTLALESTKSA